MAEITNRLTYLDWLRKLHAEATAAPWKIRWDDTDAEVIVDEGGDAKPWRYTSIAELKQDEDLFKNGALIAALRNTLPEIIAALEAGQDFAENFDALHGESARLYTLFDDALVKLDAALNEAAPDDLDDLKGNESK